MSSLLTPTPARHIDPRGMRFGAGVSAIVLAVAFLVGITPLAWLLVAAVAGLQTLLAVTGICVGCRLYFLRWFVPSLFAKLFRRTDALRPMEVPALNRIG